MGKRDMSWSNYFLPSTLAIFCVMTRHKLASQLHTFLLLIFFLYINTILFFMSYSSLTELRLLSHFSVSEISDTSVSDLIADADRAVLRLATISFYDEKLGGSIDGVNVLFTTKYKPIADVDCDSDVTDADVTVYLVAYDSENNPVHTLIPVTTVNARDGIITLTTAPTTTNAEVGVYADYKGYQMSVDYDLLKLAANYYLAHLCEMKIRTDRAVNWNAGGAGQLPPIISSKSRWLSLALDQLPFAKPSLKVM